MVEEYTHVAIDKLGVGLHVMQASFHVQGLRTAQDRGYALSAGSVRLQHHLHVFLWDDGPDGVRGRRGIEAAGNCLLLRVRWTALHRSNWLFNRSLLGDNMHDGPPGGASSNGAWAYRGNIPRDAIFIEGRDTAGRAGFENWRNGTGWTGTL